MAERRETNIESNFQRNNRDRTMTSLDSTDKETPDVSFFLQLNTVKQTISKKFEILISTLEARKQELIRDVEIIEEDYEKSRCQNRKEKDEIMKVLKEMESMTSNFNIRLKEDMVGTMKNQLRKLTNAVKWDITLHWTDILEQVQGIGSVEVNQLPDYTNRENPQTLPILTGPGEAALGYPTGIAYNHNRNQLYVVDSENNRIQIYSPDGKFIATFNKPNYNMSWPWGICISDDKVYITQQTANTLGMYTYDGKLEGMVGSKGSNNGQFKSPHGVAEYQSDAYVCDHENHRVQVFDKKLSYKRKFGDHSTLAFPTDIKTTSNELFILTLSDPCMHIYSHKGEMKRKFLEWGPGRDVVSARFFALDEHKHIILTDWGSNCIKVFTTEGKPMSKIQHSESLQEPRGLAVDSHGLVYVCSKLKGGRIVVL